MPVPEHHESVTDLSLTLEQRTISLQFGSAGVDWAAGAIADVLRSRHPRILLVTDERVALHYLQVFQLALSSRGFPDIFVEVLAAGEGSKTIQSLTRLVDRLAGEAFARDDLVVALGGGVVTDIAGFAAAIYQRGMPWVAVPTTLLGMVDAAIGGKTGIDHPLGKNLMGAFHQPLAVIAPVETLRTLDEREWVSGSAEVVKAGLLAGGAVWERVEQYGPNLFDWPRDLVFDTITAAAAQKISVVQQDERESGFRRLLNLGHTFGHALESVTDYAVFRHGEAVFLGLRAAVRLSESLDLLAAADAATIEILLEKAPFPKAEVDPVALVDALQRDKKISDGRLHWVLLKGVGKPVISADVSEKAVLNTAQWLATEIAQGSPLELQSRHLRVLVINGPNLNLLGEREPAVYGTFTYDHLSSQLSDFAAKNDVHLMIRHANGEGELVDFIQQARHWADGLVINPGGYTHTSVAVRDAISAVTVPTIEVHLSDISKREEFRRESLMTPVCAATIMGKGIRGYEEAIYRLMDLNRNMPLALGKKR